MAKKRKSHRPKNFSPGGKKSKAGRQDNQDKEIRDKPFYRETNKRLTRKLHEAAGAKASRMS